MAAGQTVNLLLYQLAWFDSKTAHLINHSDGGGETIMYDSNKTMVLMFGDIEVIKFNLRKGMLRIVNDLYVPYGLKGNLVDTTSIRSKNSMDMLGVAIDNSDKIKDWLARRVVTLSRSNANKIYDLFNFDRFDDVYSRFRISLICRSISVLDKYWLRFEDENLSWSNVNIKANSLNEVVANVALHGDSLTMQGSYNTPELTTNGLFTKAWRRHNDGSLWLYKCGKNGDVESEIEVEVSRLLDKCNVDHVKYLEGRDRGMYVCMCKCMSTDSLSVLPASEFNDYCKNNKLDFEREVLRIDPEHYYKMHIVDYLISNNDRHSNNWGFYYNNKTMKLVSLHPLFDHNSAFYSDWIANKNIEYRCTGRSMHDDAKVAMTKVDFHFTSPIVKDDFDWTEHYESFIDRAKELGIRTMCNVGGVTFNVSRTMSGD